MKAEAFLPTATTICTVHDKDDNGKLFGFLLRKLDNITIDARPPTFKPWHTNLEYQDTIISCKEWIRRVMLELAKRKNVQAATNILGHHPYFDY